MTESGHWRPKQWKAERMKRRLNRVYRHAEMQLRYLGSYSEQAILMAEINAVRRSIESREKLHAKGIPTRGWALQTTEKK